jgi:hypothetical protein
MFSDSLQFGITTTPTTVTGGNVAWSTILPRTVEVDGFTLQLVDFETSNGIMMTRVELLGSNDGGNSMVEIGRSDFRILPEGVRFLDTKIEPTRDLRVDYGPPWPLVADSVIEKLLLSICLLAVGMCWVKGNVGLGKMACQVISCLLALLNGTVGVGYAMTGYPRESFLPLTDTFIFGGAALAFAGPEYAFPHALVILGAASLAARVLDDSVIFDDAAHLAADPPAAQVAVILPGLVLLWMRRRFVKSSRAGAAADGVWREARWGTLSHNSKSTEREGLAELERAAAEIVQAWGGRY